MVRSFTEFAYTPAVRQMQKEQGASGVAGALLLDQADANDRFSAREIEFISVRDSFYQATVSESGWPYVQHRGGPKGFLKVLDETSFGYVDYSGNRQYLSDGNLIANDRVSIILMDYGQQRRLKIWGRAKLVEKKDDLDLIAKLQDEGYRAMPERAVLISLEAFDWNCPRHITQRYTRPEIEAEVFEMADEIARLREENERLKAGR